MKRRALLFLACTVSFVGAGCGSKKSGEYIPDRFVEEKIDVPASVEGSKASTGNTENVSVVPQMDTRILTESLPGKDLLDDYTSDIPTERRSPIPLPDGKRTESVSVHRIYIQDSGNEGEKNIIEASIADTRGLPVLTAFMKSYTSFDTDSGYRKQKEINGADVWITYTKDPAGGEQGFGTLIALYRDRFLIQIQGNMGSSEEKLVQVFEGFDFKKLQ